MHTEHEHDTPPGAPFDSELDVSAIVKFIVGLMILTAGVFICLWLAYNRYQQFLLKRSPAASPLYEANVPRPRPAIKVQSNPQQAMQDLLARDERHLTTYGWVDKQARVARIPVKRAMEIVAQNGLPALPGPAPEIPAAAALPVTK